MYELSDLKRAVRSPRPVLRELNRLYHTRGHRYDHNPEGICIFEENWDNLIILDACRYDFFAEQSELPGELDSRVSQGGATREFVEANFAGQQRHDTVYVTANSWFLRLKDELNAELHEVVDLHLGDGEGTYHSEEFKIVLPDVLTEHAKETAERYPNKRLIVHYIQPHHPFIGPTGREYFQRHSSSLSEVIEHADRATPQLIERAYRENLDIVLESVADLLPSLPGKTVVSADHGEMLGERHEFIPMRDYGHHESIYTDVLVKVPWLVIENGPRKRIVSEVPAADEHVDVARIEERLADLGYVI
jgi:hypothetical protein